MIRGGNVTIFVSNMDNSVRFYTESLGLKLEFSSGNDWAQVITDEGFRIGMHSATKSAPAPGTAGAMQIGFDIRESLQQEMESLAQKGITFDGAVQDGPNVKLAFFRDPDGNVLYLCEVK